MSGSPNITVHCGHCRNSDFKVGDVIIELENQMQGWKLNVGVSEVKSLTLIINDKADMNI